MTKEFLLAGRSDGRKHETPGLNTRDVSSSTIYQNDTALFAEYKQARSQWWHAPHRRKPVATSMSFDSAYLLSILNASRKRRLTDENILNHPTQEEIHSFSVITGLSNSHAGFVISQIFLKTR